MLKTSLMAICIAGSFSAFAAHADTLPSVPTGAEMDVAFQGMIYARACDIRYKRPAMVWDSKSLFLKYAREAYSDPQAITEKAFKESQIQTTRAYAKASKEFTVEFCTRLAKLFQQQLGR